MARRALEESLQAIREEVRQGTQSLMAPQIADALGVALPHRTLRYRLKMLVDVKRPIGDGSGRWARYRLPEAAAESAAAISVGSTDANPRHAPMIRLSEAGEEIRDYVQDNPTYISSRVDQLISGERATCDHLCLEASPTASGLLP